VNIIKHCPKCCQDAKFHVSGKSKKNGRPLTYRYCNRCKYRQYVNPDRQKEIRKKPINTNAYSHNGYTSCAVCKMMVACQDSVKLGLPVACEPSVGLASPVYKGRGRWDMDKITHELGWDRLPAVGD